MHFEDLIKPLLARRNQLRTEYHESDDIWNKAVIHTGLREINWMYDLIVTQALNDKLITPEEREQLVQLQIDNESNPYDD